MWQWLGYAGAAMPRPKPQPSKYLAELREQRGLEPKDVLKKLRAAGYRLPRSNFNRYETGQRHCPVAIQWQLSRIYETPFIEILRRTENLPADVITESVGGLTERGLDKTAADLETSAGPIQRTAPAEDQQMRRLLDRVDLSLVAYLGDLSAEDQASIKREVLELLHRRAIARETRDKPG